MRLYLMLSFLINKNIQMENRNQEEEANVILAQ